MFRRSDSEEFHLVRCLDLLALFWLPLRSPFVGFFLVPFLLSSAETACLDAEIVMRPPFIGPWQPRTFGKVLLWVLVGQAWGACCA